MNVDAPEGRKYQIPLELVMGGCCEVPIMDSGTCFGPLQEQYTEPFL